MMKSTTQLYARTSALPAIAAALALSSTPLLAQEAPAPTQPAVSEPAPPPVATPAPAPDEPTAGTSTETSSPVDETSTASTVPATHTVRHATRAAAASLAPKPVAVRTRVATATMHSAAPVAAAPVRTSHVNPVVDLSATPTPSAPVAAAAKPARKKDATLPIAGGALAFLAIGGAAVAMTRRRDDEEELAPEASDADAEAATPEPLVHEEQPAIIAPAAFAFEGPGNRNADATEQADRHAGESWVERAYRGPSADNPSLSLKTRLKRAAFFDKREREVAAGVAEPVESDAGLPDASHDERDLLA